MRRVPALNIPLSRVREGQGSPRNVLRAAVATAKARYSPPGEAVKRNLAGRPPQGATRSSRGDLETNRLGISDADLKHLDADLLEALEEPVGGTDAIALVKVSGCEVGVRDPGA